MPKKRFSSEQIIAKLRQIEVQLAQRKSIALACKEAAISEQSYFRWRKEYGGLQIEQAKRRKDLERENARLRRLVADLSLGSEQDLCPMIRLAGTEQKPFRRGLAD
jgi:putative transposase